MLKHSFVVLSIAAAALVSGCASGTVRMNPNPEPSLRKKPGQFAADAAKRDYPADAPRSATSPVRGEVDYQLHVLNLVNLGDSDWKDVEVWVNGKYVCAIAQLPAKVQRGVNFGSMFDKQGHNPPGSGVWMQKVELLYNGTLYTVNVRPAD